MKRGKPVNTKYGPAEGLFEPAGTAVQPFFLGSREGPFFGDRSRPGTGEAGFRTICRDGLYLLFMLLPMIRPPRSNRTGWTIPFNPPGRPGAASQGNDLGREVRRVEENDRAFSVKPAARLTRVDKEDTLVPPDLGLVGVAEDGNVARRRREEALHRSVQMGEPENPAGMLERKGRLRDPPHSLESDDQPPLFSVAVAEDRFDGAGKGAELQGRERSDKIPGMKDQVAPGILENPDRPADGGQIVVRIREDADHGAIISDSPRRIHSLRGALVLALDFCYT